MIDSLKYWHKKCGELLEREKRQKLTIADIERIHVFLYAVKNNKQGAFTFARLKDEQYQEVLDRFNNAKDYDTEQDTD